MISPDFLIIGAMKCGTTALRKHLSIHPEIFCAPNEIHYFCEDKIYEKGFDWYRENFKNEKECKIRGEKSAPYLFGEKCAERIKKDLPAAKLIISLRDPIGRLYSQYNHAHDERSSWAHYFLDKSFKDMLEMDNPYHPARFGYYAEQIERYLKFFSKDQIFISVMEERRINPESEYKKIFNFLGVDDGFKCDFRAEVHSRKRVVPPLSEQDRAYLKDIYKEPNERLFRLLGREVSCWNTEL